MKTRNLLILVLLLLLLFLSGCNTLSLLEDEEFLKEDLSKEESIEAENTFDLIVKNKKTRSSSFSGLGYDVTEEDALLYAKSSALVGDLVNEYKMLTFIGYSIDTTILLKEENYLEAKMLIREGKYTEAYNLLKKNLDYADSKKISVELINQKLVCPKVYDIGPAGGYIFYDKGFYSGGWRYLEVAPADLDGEYSFNDASIKCEQYNIQVGDVLYDDWFLPDRNILNLMYENLKKKGLGSFADSLYWSSSENGSIYAWGQSFSSGGKNCLDRNRGYRVRPVRAF